MPFVDRTLTCQNCGSSFTFTAEDQEFFEQKGFTEPRRCMPCRQQRRAERGESSYSPRTSERREMFAVVCANCGADTEVPFRPSTDRPVYCRDCFDKVRPRRY